MVSASTGSRCAGSAQARFRVATSLPLLHCPAPESLLTSRELRSVSTLPFFSIPWFSPRALTTSVIGMLGMICFPDVSSAETIYLKSGISISVTRAQEQGSQILYWVGKDQYSISKDAVARIEAGDAPGSRSAHAG